MREVAHAVGLTPAALYYHFSDKDQLYLDGVASEFQKKAETLKDSMKQGDSPWARLRNFLRRLAQLVASDKGFLRQMQWIQLDANEIRQRTLAEHVFKDLFLAMHDLVGQIAPQCNAYQTGISIIGLVMFHFEIGATRTLMPGYHASLDQPEAVAEHVYTLIFQAYSPRNGSESGVGKKCPDSKSQS